ncbi:serine/threonine-protein phosphatase Pgam5, mitochondrial isoform X1 [Bicyclus anynana]|uniref:Serine/threonine-protein phosphatase PGAM5, mitochondrial n=1 Tax=Bicyclus anynana TaxID=110368 RepID=A0A6J1N5P3_BICAN|nr:serine/threonine-protein phosphatase Pgam5, mitochondrial isoform X1 [Bicyclus anynana]
MATFSRLQKISILSLGAIGGSLAYYHNLGKSEHKYIVRNSWTTNYTPSVKWDKNWDHREPERIMKPPKSDNPEDDNRYNEQIKKSKSKAVRHLFLIRHGQCSLDSVTDNERILTELGRHQADLTGKRLALLDIKWDLLVSSTMARAQETAKIIAKHLPNDIELKDCQLIEEGVPNIPEPKEYWTHEPRVYQDNARIEAAFQRYFHRAPPDQTQDSYTLIVGHLNVIRFFVCRALQFPPEAWLRMSLNNGSITWISIKPSGNVILRSLNDTGHLDPQDITIQNQHPEPEKLKVVQQS